MCMITHATQHRPRMPHTCRWPITNPCSIHSVAPAGHGRCVHAGRQGLPGLRLSHRRQDAGAAAGSRLHSACALVTSQCLCFDDVCARPHLAMAGLVHVRPTLPVNWPAARPCSASTPSLATTALAATASSPTSSAAQARRWAAWQLAADGRLVPRCAEGPLPGANTLPPRVPALDCKPPGHTPCNRRLNDRRCAWTSTSACPSPSWTPSAPASAAPATTRAADTSE